MRKTDRYLRLVIIMIISVVSLSGMALVNTPGPDNHYWDKQDKVAAYGQFFQSTLSSSFENSLQELNIKNQNLLLNLHIEKGFEIDNRLFDVGLIYHVKIHDHFSDRKALRKMLDVLSENYPHIRRESTQEDSNGDLHSLEESGFVYTENEKFSYINRIISRNNEAWILILTYQEQSKSKVRELLNSIWIENRKGLS